MKIIIKPIAKLYQKHHLETKHESKNDENFSILLSYLFFLFVINILFITECREVYTYTFLKL